MSRVLVIGTIVASLWFGSTQYEQWVETKRKADEIATHNELLEHQRHMAAIEAHFENPPLPEYTEDELIEIRKKKRVEMIAASKKCFAVRDCARLAEAAYFEDRGGGVEGMEAVVSVILNRVDSKSFPRTISDVIYQKRPNKRGVIVCQFSYVCELSDRRMKEPESRYKAGYVAWKAFSGRLPDPTNGADHYYNPDKVKTPPKFALVYEQVAEISDHVFFRSM